MEFTSFLVRNFSYPLWMLKDGKKSLFRYNRTYRNYNNIDVTRIKKMQMLNLSSILIHAKENTDYYQAKFKECNFDPYKIKNVNELRQLPILTKDVIRQNLDNLLANNILKDKLYKDSTGGSTGTPLVFFRDKNCIIRRKAQELFFDRWMGYQIGDKIALFVAAPHNIKGMKGWKRRFRNLTGERILAFNPYRTDEKYMAEFVTKLQKFKPKIIKCFPNSLYIFAQFLKRNGIDNIKAEAVSSTGDTLFGYQRELFEEVFKCPVFEKYGTFEVGVAACECTEHNGMHMFLDGVYFEFLNEQNLPAREGELASMVVTDLFNYGMPLIRYKIGDIAVISDQNCSCGSSLPLIKKLYGRDRDILIDENGIPRPGYLFVEIFNKNHIPGQFQVIQESHSDILIKAIKKDDFSEYHENLILKKFKELLGNKVKIKIQFVDDIPREPSGKYKYIHSRVSPFIKS